MSTDPSDLFLAIDLGTTSIKAGLFDGSGVQRARFAQSYLTHRAAGGMYEQDPRAWTALVACRTGSVSGCRPRPLPA